MVRRIIVGAHYGLRDWLSQRITGALMALFTVILLAQVQQADEGEEEQDEEERP